MTPAAALLVHDLHPELMLLRTDRGDMIDPEEWGAILSPSGVDGASQYRYLLWRVFGRGGRLLLVLMLNPSVADHLAGDRTADGLVRRARRLGYDGILVANCFAHRATKPAEMRRAADPVGPANDDVLRIVLDQELDLLCAWGVGANHLEREREVLCAVEKGRARPHALRLCSGGSPEHPLYVPSAIAPTPWRPTRDGASVTAGPTSTVA